MDICIIPAPGPAGDKFIIYRPLIGLAFIGNLAMARLAESLATRRQKYSTVSTEIADFLRAIGDHLKNHFKGWRCGILAPASSPLNEIGLKPQKKAAFLNGAVPVKLVVFDIY